VYKASVLFLFGLLVVGLVGCGSNPREREIEEVVKLIGETADVYRGLKTEMKAAVDKHSKAKDKIPAAEWKKWTLKAGVLKDIAHKAQLYKGHLEGFREATPEDQKKKFADAYGGQFVNSVQELDQEERGLYAVLEEAAPLAESEKAVDDFRKQLKESKELFEMLTKQR